MKKNFFLDVILFISSLICIVTGIVMDFHLISGGREIRYFIRQAHTYTGYVMAICVVVHLLWHVSWIKAAAKNLFKKKIS